ncbi:BON domain-containing protein [Mycoavidus sp. SF9855]|uniref:BON domain-containing protein n=1 Tax=Mycoavidus sp. SF9855 TaxID=2968475 RepID=UPI00211C02BE|nr:BON domain-containing protein [Mycoavidus sp. SF9855]UUM20737.1 BON domain-containing protein [Mycoavidus sp. SF9855]
MKTNAQLYEDIMDKLDFEPSVNASNITVAVNGEVVVLGGTVGSLFEKHTAERAIKSIAGVKAVANELRVELASQYRVSDVDIANAAVNALKWNSTLPQERPQVAVEGGHVTLTGKVNWWYQREAAEKAIRWLSGVKSLNNQITIQSSLSPKDIKALITKEFHRHAQVDAERIHVEIEGSKVILKGRVGTWLELQEAKRGAWSAPGVVSVVTDELVIG